MYRNALSNKTRRFGVESCVIRGEESVLQCVGGGEGEPYFTKVRSTVILHMGCVWSVGSIKLYVSFEKESYKRDNIMKKGPMILSILLTAVTP